MSCSVHKQQDESAGCDDFDNFVLLEYYLTGQQPRLVESCSYCCCCKLID